MHEYVIKRLLLFVPTVLMASVIVFVLIWLMPSDAAEAILIGSEGEGAGATASIEALRAELGLDRPIHIQYVTWLWDTVRGDLGDSFYYRRPVSDDLMGKFFVTMQLAVMGMGMAVLIAVPLGVLSAVKQDGWPDHFARLFTTVGIAVPSFWLAILIVYMLTYGFGWLPPLQFAQFWENPWLNLQQMVFPALAIALHDLAFSARVTRSAMLEVMREDYIRTARAKGLVEWRVLGRHALKNALLPVITVSGYQFGRLLGGVIIIESVFVVPGMGLFLVDAIQHKDFMIIQAVIVLVGVVVLTLNLLIDLVYGLLDPRVRFQ